MIELGQLTFDKYLATISNKNGGKVLLKPIEVKLLSRLIDFQGRLLSKPELLESVWVRHVSNSTIDKAFSCLRSQLRKLDDSCEYIETRRKLGYRLSVDVRAIKQTTEKEHSALNNMPGDGCGLLKHFSIENILFPRTFGAQ